MPKTRAPHSVEKRSLAELLYVIERRTRAEVIERTGVSPSSFDRWRKKYGWDERRAASIVSIPKIVQDMQADIARTYQLAADENRPLTAGERDGVQKTIKAMLQLDKGALFASHAVQVMDLFSSYLDQYAPELKPALVEHIVTFTGRLAQTPLVG